MQRSAPCTPSRVPCTPSRVPRPPSAPTSDTCARTFRRTCHSAARRQGLAFSSSRSPIETTIRRADGRVERIPAQNSTPANLFKAVQIIGRGDVLLAPDVTRRVIERCAGRSTSAKAVIAAVDGLTVREREVLGLLARGMSNAEIASTLYVGEATVKSHVSKVLQKLVLRDRVHAWSSPTSTASCRGIEPPPRHRV